MKKSKRSRKDADPIAEYREWAENRYNPGYWLGGKVPPTVKNLWTPKDRRWIGGCLVGVSGLAVWFAIFGKGIHPPWLVLLSTLPFLILGLILLFARDPKRR